MKINSSFLISSVLNEVKILQSVSHPNVINLVDVIYTLDYSYIVLELAKGGELLDKIIKKTRFNETEAKLHFYKMASGMECPHSRKFVTEISNLKVSSCVLKMTRIRLSRSQTWVSANSCSETNIEVRVLSGSYSLNVNCWGLGVILYIRLSVRTESSSRS